MPRRAKRSSAKSQDPARKAARSRGAADVLRQMQSAVLGMADTDLVALEAWVSRQLAVLQRLIREEDDRGELASEYMCSYIA